MSSRKPRIPSYRHHKPSGQAVVTLNGRDIYLGAWDTPQGLRISLGRLSALGKNGSLLLCRPAGWESHVSCTIDRRDSPTTSGTSAP